jgi:hypothetical protein
VYLEPNVLEVLEVGGVASEKWKVVGEGDRGDQEVDCSGAAWLACTRSRCGVDASVDAGCLVIEWQGIERGLGPLEPFLAAGALGCVIGGMRPCCEFRKRQGRHGCFAWEPRGFDLVEIDDDRRIEKTAFDLGRLWFGGGHARGSTS